MGDERQIWLGRNDERFGPYDESLVRQWVAEGKVVLSMLAWCEGMSSWQPLHQVLGMAPEPGAPPPMPGAYDALANDSRRASLPEPPTLHWFLLMLISLVTFGIMGVVWSFVQASWVKKIDPPNRSTQWFIASLVLLGLGWAVSFGVGIPTVMFGRNPSVNTSPLLWLNVLFSLGCVVCKYAGFFTMAASMRRALPSYGLVPAIGGVTLFFFTVFYLQGQLRWVAEWQRTGRTEPPAPKGVFWLLWLIPAVLMLLVVVGLTVNHHHPAGLR